MSQQVVEIRNLDELKEFFKRYNVDYEEGRITFTNIVMERETSKFYPELTSLVTEEYDVVRVRVDEVANFALMRTNKVNTKVPKQSIEVLFKVGEDKAIRVQNIGDEVKIYIYNDNAPPLSALSAPGVAAITGPISMALVLGAPGEKYLEFYAPPS